MIGSPTSSLLDDKPRKMNDLTNPEFAALIEKQHLKECEDMDYKIMERLLQTRCSIDEGDEAMEVAVGNEYSQRRMLRRETAIEMPVTPSKSSNVMVSMSEDAGKDQMEFQRKDTIKLSPLSMSTQNSPKGSQFLPNTAYLNAPDYVNVPRLYKKSNESLQKNSSTDTEYSLQPYRLERSYPFLCY